MKATIWVCGWRADGFHRMGRGSAGPRASVACRGDDKRLAPAQLRNGCERKRSRRGVECSPRSRVDRPPRVGEPEPDTPRVNPLRSSVGSILGRSCRTPPQPTSPSPRRPSRRLIAATPPDVPRRFPSLAVADVVIGIGNSDSDASAFRESYPGVEQDLAIHYGPFDRHDLLPLR